MHNMREIFHSKKEVLNQYYTDSTEEKPLKCTTCWKCLKGSGCLKKHEEMHTSNGSSTITILDENLCLQSNY